MPDRQSEQGSWVHKKRQSDGAGCDGNSKNLLIAFISPCQRGLAVSLFVAAMTTDKSDFRRIAAPKILFPDATPLRVSGTMSFSMTSSKRTSVASRPELDSGIIAHLCVEVLLVACSKLSPINGLPGMFFRNILMRFSRWSNRHASSNWPFA